LFKSTLFISLRAKEFKYEDYLSCIFGNHVCSRGLDVVEEGKKGVRVGGRKNKK